MVVLLDSLDRWGTVATGRRGAARGGKRDRKRAPGDVAREARETGRLAGFMLGRQADAAIGQIDEAGMARAGGSLERGPMAAPARAGQRRLIA
ncbi:hypothetical protein ACYT84_18525 [Ralstonia solanacearum]|nr:hypothetical protein [Ralstonia solanacearum]MBB6593405.1 hypothetical protein [Ralstonia solanacearum]MBB6597632.1 hypothetical protein [Ralstonia solanacearum]MDB0509728.1 hypothetical protein [Ralstonia solanacearum]MDB0511799.1 hypothetical protein [Ralstonia solanacearum]MDB0542393.1 hypothetical protein [Ralstonia solanacearum]